MGGISSTLLICHEKDPLFPNLPFTANKFLYFKVNNLTIKQMFLKLTQCFKKPYIHTYIMYVYINTNAPIHTECMNEKRYRQNHLNHFLGNTSNI